MLMKSMGRYVHARLTTTEGKQAYQKAMQFCINETSLGLTNLEIVKARIQGVREDSIHRYKKTLFNRRHQEFNAWNLACDQALEIVNSIEARFLNGQHDAEPRMYRNSTWFLYEDENLFE